MTNLKKGDLIQDNKTAFTFIKYSLTPGKIVVTNLLDEEVEIDYPIKSHNKIKTNMATTVKPDLTLDYVKSVMDSLIKQNSSTTTLDIKLEMRKSGLWCNQDEVHNLVEEIYELNSNDYKRTLVNRHHYEYSAVVVTPISTQTTSNVNTGNVKTNTLLSIDMPKMSFKFNELKALGQYPNQNDWLVYNETINKYSIFDESLTRDLIRSKFASLNKVKFQDVRSRRIARTVDLIS